jgi:DNA repair protein RecN (Recombination protein N)
MLTYLAIKNVSVIEEVSFELSNGLIVLTGETGSGKSVLVGALKLLLGERFQKNMLREGAEKLMVEGIFDNVSSIPDSLKEQFDIEDELVIRREADDAGKNRVFINNKLSTVSQLKEFAPYLADIHGQHEHQTLLDESKHLSLIDYLVPNDIKNAYLSAYQEYKSVKNRRDALLATFEDVKKREDILKFQLNEIAGAEIEINKDIELEERISFMTHIEKIQSASAISLEALSDGEINASELISKSIKALSPIEGVMSEIALVNNRLAEAADIITETTRLLGDIFGRHEISAEELDKLMQRKYLLQDLIKKYTPSGTLQDLVAKKEELASQLNNFENSDELLNTLTKEMEELYIKAKGQADILNSARDKVSEDISKQIVDILGELELPIVGLW